jgi:hypothetical protein
MAEILSFTAHRSHLAADDDVTGYCEVRASAGDLFAVLLPPTIDIASLGGSDQFDGRRESASQVVDPETLAIWSCRPGAIGIQPATQL